MARELREADLRALLGVAAIEPGVVTEAGLQQQMLERAADLIGCDNASFVEFDPHRCEGYVEQVHPTELPADGIDETAFMRNYWDCVGCSYPSSSGDELTVTKLSDFYTLPALRSTGMYAEYLSYIGFEREIMLCIPSAGDRTRRLIFFRGRGSDFTERDRLLLALLRPHLIDAYRRLEDSRRVQPDLTARQRELLRLVAAGNTNAEIASRMFISPLTVRKHLENIFERLGVTNRAAAVAVAFPPKAE